MSSFAKESTKITYAIRVAVSYNVLSVPDFWKICNTTAFWFIVHMRICFMNFVVADAEKVLETQFLGKNLVTLQVWFIVCFSDSCSESNAIKIKIFDTKHSKINL